MKNHLVTDVLVMIAIGQFVITNCPSVYAASVSRIERAILEEHFAEAKAWAGSHKE